MFVEKNKNFKYEMVDCSKIQVHTIRAGKHFYNLDRCNAYDISPYEETIMIDADYLILSDALNSCWGHNNELMMNWKYDDIMYEREDDSLKRLHPTGITMYWATVVYFKKTEFTKQFFETVKHVKDNSRYYQDLYWEHTQELLKNDYSFSVAAHMLGGFEDKATVNANPHCTKHLILMMSVSGTQRMN